MGNACKPILVGVASLVLEISLLSILAKFPFRTMDNLLNEHCLCHYAIDYFNFFSSFASSSRNSPIHLWDAFDGHLRCSYLSYNHVVGGYCLLQCLYVLM